MAIYVTKRCPHCNYAYQFHKSGNQRSYGCPYQICKNCRKPYWDTDIKEPALYGYENAYESVQSFKKISSLILICLMECLFLFCGMVMAFSGQSEGYGMLIVGIGVIFAVYPNVKKYFEEKRNPLPKLREQISSYDSSLKRLQDTDYLTALAKHDARAYQLLYERKHGLVEHYAQRPS